MLPSYRLDTNGFEIKGSKTARKQTSSSHPRAGNKSQKKSSDTAAAQSSSKESNISATQSSPSETIHFGSSGQPATPSLQPDASRAQGSNTQQLSSTAAASQPASQALLATNQVNGGQQPATIHLQPGVVYGIAANADGTAAYAPLPSSTAVPLNNIKYAIPNASASTAAPTPKPAPPTHGAYSQAAAPGNS